MTDSEMLDWLERRTRKSSTGISFDWVPSVEGEPSGFRFMRRHFIGDSAKTLRQAIEKAAGQEIAQLEEKEAPDKATVVKWPRDDYWSEP